MISVGEKSLVEIDLFPGNTDVLEKYWSRRDSGRVHNAMIMSYSS
jgi:hypothetical protein